MPLNANDPTTHWPPSPGKSTLRALPRATCVTTSQPPNSIPSSTIRQAYVEGRTAYMWQCGVVARYCVSQRQLLESVCTQLCAGPAHLSASHRQELDYKQVHEHHDTAAPAAAVCGDCTDPVGGGLQAGHPAAAGHHRCQLCGHCQTVQQPPEAVSFCLPAPPHPNCASRPCTVRPTCCTPDEHTHTHIHSNLHACLPYQHALQPLQPSAALPIQTAPLASKALPLAFSGCHSWTVACRALLSHRLVPGDVIVVLPGKATCDMVLLRGSCLVEESLLSGEVRPPLPCSIAHTTSLHFLPDCRTPAVGQSQLCCCLHVSRHALPCPSSSTLYDCVAALC